MNWQKRAVMKGHTAPVYACTTDGSFVYGAAGDRFVARWNIQTGEQDGFSVKLDSPAYTLEYCAQLQLLIAGCTNGTIVAIDLVRKSLVWEKNFHGKALFSLADCPDAQLLVAGDQDGLLSVISYAGQLLATFPLDCGKIRKLRVSGYQLFVACQDGTWRMFSIPEFNEEMTVQAHQGGVTAIYADTENHTLITGGKDAYIRVWDLLSLAELVAFPAHYQTVYDLLEIQGYIVSVSMDKTIKIWDPSNWKVVERIEAKNGGHSRSVNGAVVLPDGFATFSDDKTIQLHSI